MVQAFAFSLIGATFWGLSGTASEALFRLFDMNPVGLLGIRMTLSGGIMILIFRPKFPWEMKKLFLIYTATSVVLQLSYFETIFLSSAPTATFLQFMYFPIVVIIEVINGKLKAGLRISLGLLCAIAGITLLTVSIDGALRVSVATLVVGLICATSAAAYTLLSSPLVQKYGSRTIVSWSLTLGAVFTLPIGFPYIYKFFAVTSISDLPLVILLILFIVIFGTIGAFSLYSTGMRRISSSSASVAGSVEPVSASLSSSIFLGDTLGDAQYLGGFLIICSIIFSQLGISRQKPAGSRIRKFIKLRSK